jgi:superkiller protein 3
MIAAALYDALIRAGALGGPPVPPLTFDEAFARRRPAPAVVGESDRRAAMLYNTGYVLATQGHYQEAMEKYQACLEINPFYFAARLNLGVLRYGAGQIAESLRDFEEVLDYAPDNQQARVAKGWALMGLGRYAVEVFREATKHDPRDAQAWYGLGAAFQRQGGRAEDAEAAFRRAIELQPRYGDASCALGQLLLASRRTDEAVTRFEQCVDTRPQDSATRAWLGWALQMKGRREDAVAAYRVSLKLDPSNPYAKQGLAQMGGAAP